MKSKRQTGRLALLCFRGEVRSDDGVCSMNPSVLTIATVDASAVSLRPGSQVAPRVAYNPHPQSVPPLAVVSNDCPDVRQSNPATFDVIRASRCRQRFHRPYYYRRNRDRAATSSCSGRGSFLGAFSHCVIGHEGANGRVLAADSCCQAWSSDHTGQGGLA